jgi:hypothetical protein
MKQTGSMAEDEADERTGKPNFSGCSLEMFGSRLSPRMFVGSPRFLLTF